MGSKKNNKLKKKKRKKGSYTKNDPYPALNPKRQVYARREAMEGDYYHLLNEEEREWLNAFLSETVVTNFYHGGPELYKKKADKRLFYRDNNSRNKDIINWAKANSMLSNVEDIQTTLDRQDIQLPSEIEDSWIEAMAIKNSGRLRDELENLEDSVSNSKKKPKKSNALANKLKKITPKKT